jgi:integrase
MTHRIDTVEARKRLTVRPAPHWQKLSSTCHLGFRKMSAASEGTWVAQSYDPDTRKQTRRSLGAFEALPAHQRFDAAKKAAELWFGHLDKGGSTDTVTVKEACENYVKHARADAKTEKAYDLERRFTRWVYENPIGRIDLAKLTRTHVDTWRRLIADTDVVINPHAKVHKTRTRAPSSINREMTGLRAALNFAHDAGHVTNDMAWRVALRPIENADRRRDAYLDRPQRVALIGAAAPDIAHFLTAMSLIPLRPGALASLKVSHFDQRLGVLTVGKDKHGRDRRIKLPAKTAGFFCDCTTDKLPAAPLLARADGAVWDRDAWKKPVKTAVKAAKLPDAITAYAMRHSVITDLVTGGLDLLTIAQLSGTSVAMIEKHYGHLQADHAATALAALAL